MPADKNSTWKTVAGWIVGALIATAGLVYGLTAGNLKESIVKNETGLKEVNIKIEDHTGKIADNKKASELNKNDIDHLEKEIEELKDMKKQLDRIEKAVSK